MKFKVGQLLLASAEAAAINQGPTYVVVAIGDQPRPYLIRQINGEPIRLSTAPDGAQKWYKLLGAWASESKLRALPDEDAPADAVETVYGLELRS